jgi:cardiolipin synthase A/B
MWIAALVAAVLALIIIINLSTGEKKIEHELTHLYGVDDPQFARTVGTLLGPTLVPGNQVTPLHNGEQIFSSMLEAIRGARRSINFETYIYWSGEVGRRFADALSERARAGVKVHLLIDAVGSARLDAKALLQMREAGVEIVKFHPVRWYTLGRLNNRTHRKLLVVDGKIGFTGGVGIADKWDGHAQDPEHWRDSHFRLEGPAVGQMQAAFMDHWIAARSLVLHGEDYFPVLNEVGGQWTQTFKSGADDGVESVRLMYLLSLTAATRSIRLASAYFVPDDLTIQTLIRARERGVSIDVVVPGRHTDALVVGKASRACWGRLLEAGVAIYEYQPTMYHCKVMIVDDCWTSVGSTNFDNRSFRLNDEANLNILDEAFARAESKTLDQDIARSVRVTPESWRRRPWTEKLAERFAALLRTQL